MSCRPFFSLILSCLIFLDITPIWNSLDLKSDCTLSRAASITELMVTEFLFQILQIVHLYSCCFQEIDERLLQSAIGVVFGENDKELYTDNYAQQLTRWGYEKMVLPKVDRAVEITQPNDGYLSIFALIYRTYGVIWQFILEKRLETTLALEFYDKDEICVTFPLDHVDEFIIPDSRPLEKKEKCSASRSCVKRVPLRRSSLLPPAALRNGVCRSAASLIYLFIYYKARIIITCGKITITYPVS
ncbi:unnamed protein product [Heligmosomoides polygyrus]|uniref:DUF3828 domain-containing protein n=1 Tax=Heligmosomoides polygyrus TaxID=6339 RepID=A0A183GKG4_HELPZ|nr:unnamed protein product [Heligmosomoides polygyrus]